MKSKIARLYISTFILYWETSTCFETPIVAATATTRQKQSCSFRLFSSTQQNQHVEKRERRLIDLPKSGKKATVVSRTVPITSDYSLTVWEWENPAQVVESYWEASQHTNDGCLLMGDFESPGSRLLDPFGLVSWPGSMVASQELYQNIDIAVKDKTVLIVGAGVGLEAQAAALFGAKQVIATDIHPTTIRQLEFGVQQDERIDKNVVKTQILDLFAHDDQPLPTTDVLIVADVLYNEQLASQVVRRIVEAWVNNNNIKVLITDSQRFVPGFVDELNQLMAQVDGPSTCEWTEQALHAFTGSGVIIDEDQTYDVKVRKMWIGL